MRFVRSARGVQCKQTWCWKFALLSLSLSSLLSLLLLLLLLLLAAWIACVQEGAELDITKLPPLNFNVLPNRVSCLKEVISTLKVTDVLLAQLDNLANATKFAHFLKISLIQHTP
eukprot:1875165-Amphidinium_carterae.1